MHRFPRFGSLLLAATAFATASPAFAQASDDAAALRAEMEAMRVQMEAMSTRMDSLQTRLAEAEAPAAAPAPAAVLAAATPAAADNDLPAILWKGAPVIEGEGGWSFKPRGRLNYDAGYVSSPDGIENDGLGFSNEARRIRLGVEGDIPGGFGYKLELDFAGNETEVTDAILSYETGNFEAKIGQHNNFQGLEELTSSRFSSFIERAAFTDAFGFERRIGISGEYQAGDLLVQAGVFTDNMEDLDDDGNDSHSFDGRVVFMPRLGDTQLHFGGSAHYRKLGDSIDAVRYRQRPLVHSSDVRFINTGTLTADTETGLGLEAAAIFGRLHMQAESFWQTISRPGFSDPTFFGGAVEVGYFLTDDRRGYKNGTFDRVKPTNGLEKGGIGAWQINARYDRLDLTDANIVGGTQDGYMLSLVWTPTAYTRFLANYARLQYDNAAIPAAGGDRDYGVNVVAMRAQIDF